MSADVALREPELGGFTVLVLQVGLFISKYFNASGIILQSDHNLLKGKG